MANLVNLIPLGRYNENLYPSSKINYNIVGTPGSTITQNVFSANTDTSLRVLSSSVAPTIIDFTDGVTVKRDGIYGFSLYFCYFTLPNDWQISLKVYKNGILLQNFNSDLGASGFVLGKWNVYGQTFSLNANDVITFRLEATTGIVGNVLYISAPKFEILDKCFNIPSYYTYPTNHFSKSTDLQLTETQWDVPDIGAQIISNGSSINLLTLIDDGTDKNITNTDVFDELNIVSNSIKTTYRNCKIAHTIRLSFNIDSGSEQFYQVQIRRTIDNSIVYRMPVLRNADETIQTIEMTTRTLSNLDPFTIDGFYLAFVNNSGASATLDGAMSLVVINHYQKGQKQ